jgi:hypothetical protein
MNERLLKIIIYIVGIVCIYAFVAIRIPPMFNAVLKEKIIPEYWENTKYGELYYFNHIRHFREKDLPPHSEKYRFSEHQFENSQEKILLFESAERYIPQRFDEPHRVSLIVDPRSRFRKIAAEIRDYIFMPDNDILYGTLLSRNYLTSGIYSFNATLKFDIFKFITDMTPVYYLGDDRPWLFYHEQVNEEPSSFYYQHSQHEIDTYCDNIADLASNLYIHYKLKMVFMAIPSKYTIYHTFLNDDPYNDFIPRLYTGLEKQGIPVIPLYEDFINSEEVLYFGTDTHWNAKGLSIAIDYTVELLDSLNNKNRYYECSNIGRRVWNKDK